MNNTIHYAGLDIHASNTVIQSIDPNGVQIQQREIPPQADKLIHWARTYPHGQLQVILEQGTHARWVANALAEWVDQLVICGPAANALVHAGGTKNDRTDAHKLARLLRLGEYKPIWWKPSEERHVFKSAMKMYLRQRKAKTAAIQRLTHYLRHIGVRIPVGQSRFSFKRASQWLEQVDTEGKLPAGHPEACLHPLSPQAVGNHLRGSSSARDRLLGGRRVRQDSRHWTYRFASFFSIAGRSPSVCYPQSGL